MAITLDLAVRLTSGPRVTVKVELGTDAGTLAMAREISKAAKDLDSALGIALSASPGANPRSPVLVARAIYALLR